MAQGDLLFFNDFVDDLGKGKHVLGTDTIKFALVSNSTVPAVTTADPCFGAGGTTNFASTEVSGTGYTSGGEDISATFSTTTDTGTLDGTGPSWSQNGAGPTNIRWGIIYNDSATNKDCIAFVDMGGGSDISLQDGDISYTFHGSGIGTITRT